MPAVRINRHRHSPGLGFRRGGCAVHAARRTLKMTVPSLPEDGERSATPTGATPRDSRDRLEPAVKNKLLADGGILLEGLAATRDRRWSLQDNTVQSDERGGRQEGLRS